MSWNIGSFFVSSIGVVIALFSLWKSSRAMRMAERVVRRKDAREDSVRFRDLISLLKDAKKATMRRQSTAHRSRTSGIPLGADIERIQKAQDALKTELPLSLDPDVQTSCLSTAGEIQSSISAIQTKKGGRDHWRDILSSLQVIIPELEHAERDHRTKELLDQ